MLTLDLRPDAVAIRAMVNDGVRDYSAKHVAAGTAKKHPPVSRLDLTYSLGDSESTPWVMLNFDTKPGGEPDGTPTHGGFAELERESWLPAVQAVCDEEKVDVVNLDGRTKRCDDAALGQVIGELLVSILREARAAGVFTNLPKVQRCELGVEESNGEFGWPTYEDRGKDNVA